MTKTINEIPIFNCKYSLVNYNNQDTVSSSTVQQPSIDTIRQGTDRHQPKRRPHSYISGHSQVLTKMSIFPRIQTQCMFVRRKPLVWTQVPFWHGSFQTSLNRQPSQWLPLMDTPLSKGTPRALVAWRTCQASRNNHIGVSPRAPSYKTRTRAVLRAWPSGSHLHTVRSNQSLDVESSVSPVSWEVPIKHLWLCYSRQSCLVWFFPYGATQLKQFKQNKR